MEDLHAVLGVAPSASPQELTAAFRALAKRSHPDATGGGAAATRRMAELNAAYESLRRRHGRGPKPGLGRRGRADSEAGLVLGVELGAALQPGEAVQLVTPVMTRASLRALLAVTDRRVLWLEDDAVMGRVRSLALRELVAAEVSLAWPRRRRATVALRGRDGRRHAFSGVSAATATQVARAVQSTAVS